jgi:hypothetical protein
MHFKNLCILLIDLPSNQLYIQSTNKALCISFSVEHIYALSLSLSLSLSGFGLKLDFTP